MNSQDDGIVCVPGRTDGTVPGFIILAQKGVQFTACELLISENFYLIFMGKLQKVKPLLRVSPVTPDYCNCCLFRCCSSSRPFWLPALLYTGVN